MIEDARRVKVHVSIGGHDATSWSAPYLLDFTYTDKATGQADEIQITLHDREGKWNGSWKPQKGDEVEASIECFDWFEIGDSVKLPCGVFKIDEIEFTGPPDKVRIKAVTSKLVDPLRDVKNTDAWENTDLETLAGDIAGEADLELDYDGPAHNFIREDQRDESDLAFIHRLAVKYGMHCRVHNDTLILRDINKAMDQDGAVTIYKTKHRFSPKSYSFKQSSSDTAYSGYKAAYEDPVEGYLYTAEGDADTQTTGDKVYNHNKRAESDAQAEELAKHVVTVANSSENTGSMEIMGHPGIIASLAVKLEEFGSFSGDWFVTETEHRVSGNGGYTTSMKLAKKGTLGAGEDVPDETEEGDE